MPRTITSYPKNHPELKIKLKFNNIQHASLAIIHIPNGPTKPDGHKVTFTIWGHMIGTPEETWTLHRQHYGLLQEKRNLYDLVSYAADLVADTKL